MELYKQIVVKKEMVSYCCNKFKVNSCEGSVIS